MKKLTAILTLTITLFFLLGSPMMHASEPVGGGVCATHCVDSMMTVPLTGIPAPTQLLVFGAILIAVATWLRPDRRHARGRLDFALLRPPPDITTLYGRFLI